MKRSLPYLIIFIGILCLWGLYKIFFPELTDLKEQYLIKKNYEDHVETFRSSVHDFNAFQNVSIDFSEGNYIDAHTSGFSYSAYDPIVTRGLYERGEIGQLTLDDSLASFAYRGEQYEIQSFEVENSHLKIELKSDSVIVLDNYWAISYTGFGTSDLFPELLNSLGVNTVLLEELKTQLRRRNCFGFSNDQNRLVLHFRSRSLLQLLVFSYSYCILKNKEAEDRFFEKTYHYGQLDEHMYWFFNDPVQVIELYPGGYENRNI